MPYPRKGGATKDSPGEQSELEFFGRAGIISGKKVINRNQSWGWGFRNDSNSSMWMETSHRTSFQEEMKCEYLLQCCWA